MTDYTAFIAVWPASGTTAQKLDAVNAMKVPGTPPANAYLTGAQIYNAIVPSEFQALTAALQVIVRDVLGLGGNIDVNVGTNARVALLQAFGAGSVTRTNLAALVTAAIAPPAIPWWRANNYSSPFNEFDAIAAGVS